jgi:hypothetical protein
MPLSGDLRAFDAVLRGPVSIGLEFVTRMRDVQALVRAVLAKQRDMRTDRVVLVIAATRANRAAVREAQPVLGMAFPVRSRTVMARLGAGVDPGGSAIVFL